MEQFLLPVASQSLKNIVGLKWCFILLLEQICHMFLSKRNYRTKRVVICYFCRKMPEALMKQKCGVECY